MTNTILGEAESVAADVIPGVGAAKTVLGGLTAVWPVFAGLGGVGLIAAGWLYVGGLQRQRDAALAQAAQQHAAATVAQGQSAAQAGAAKIVDQGAAKADVTVHIQQENQSAILTAPGAGQAVDPGLMSALDGGLCRYDAYAADPQCHPVRGADPAPLPPADPGSAVAPGDGGGPGGLR